MKLATTHGHQEHSTAEECETPDYARSPVSLKSGENPQIGVSGSGEYPSSTSGRQNAEAGCRCPVRSPETVHLRPETVAHFSPVVGAVQDTAFPGGLMRRLSFLAVACAVAVVTLSGCSPSTPTTTPAKPSPQRATASPSPGPDKTRAEVTADLRVAGQDLGTYTDLNPRLAPGACMVSARRLSGRVLTMRDAQLAARRLQQRGWKLGRVKPETIALRSGEWHAALAALEISGQNRASELAPYKGALVLTATGSCGRR